MVGGFFSLLIGYFVFLIMTYREGNKVWKQEKIEQNDNKQYAITFNKPVWFKNFEKDKEIYIETRSNRKIYKEIDKNGLNRWYYLDTKKPMKYIEDNRILQSLNRNRQIALSKNKKWCVVENFWDDSIIRLINNRGIGNTYLDDFTDRGNPFEVFEWNNYVKKWNKENPNKMPKNIIRNSTSVSIYYSATPEQQLNYKKYFYDNNPLNQKIYLKNMRPYQLYALAVGEGKQDFGLIKQKQYLIRFGNLNYFNFKTQYNILDKKTKAFWSKWYAITEKEYLALTTTNKGLNNNYQTLKVKTVNDLKFIQRPIKINDIAFVDKICNLNWDLENCGIKKAFDIEGNFIEDKIN